MVVVIKRGMSRQRIQALWKRVREGSSTPRRKVDVYKYLGVLKVEDDPVELQRKWRNEWE